MSYINSVENFNQKFDVQLDAVSIAAAVSRFLTTYPLHDMREKAIKDYIITSYGEFAAQHEQNRQKASIESTGHSVPTDAKELLMGYLSLMGEIVKEVSEIKAQEMKQAQIDAKEEAKKARDIAEKASAEANEARNKRTYDANSKIKEANKLVERANLRMERANDDAAFYFEPWASTSQDFGLSSKEAQKMLQAQVKGAKYFEIRREQMRRLGVKNPLFMEGVNALEGVSYSNATPEALENMRNVYITRELMQARLKRHNFLWKLIFRSQTKAMENYIKAADSALNRAVFPETEKTAIMNDLETGIRSNAAEVNAISNEFKDIFKENDQKIEDLAKEKAEREQKRREEKEKKNKQKEEEQRIKDENKQKEQEQKDQQNKALIEGKEEEIQNEVNAVASTKSAPDSFFEIRFRPTLDPDLSKAEADLCAKIGAEYIQGKKDLPAGLKAVFSANYKKVREAREYVKNDLVKLSNDKDSLKAKKDALEAGFAIREENLKLDLAKENIDYKPITFDQLKLQSKLAKDLSVGSAGDKQTKATELNVPKKENPSKNI